MDFRVSEQSKVGVDLPHTSHSNIRFEGHALKSTPRSWDASSWEKAQGSLERGDEQEGTVGGPG